MGIEVKGPKVEGSETILTREALALVERLHRELNSRRLQLLARRAERQRELDRGEEFRFLPDTKQVRDGDWKVAPYPKDLAKRFVEITGPVERKMMINALNSGADVFMADFEDALSPTWSNIVVGHQNLKEAVRRTLAFTSPEGKQYKLNQKIATLLVRPRGWHLPEKHVLVDGEAISGSLIDFGLTMFHNAREQLDRGTGPYFYLPKLESHLEARLWNDAFVLVQDALKIPRGSIRATVLVETLPAAFEMDEILYELREHSSGLNAGRWDYMFSLIKKFRTRKDKILPDRVQVTMTVPFMRAYTELLIKTCHRRGAHAMGGMAPFIPSRKNPEINEKAMAKTREDKKREVTDGFDGTWVAHPDLVQLAHEEFEKVLGRRANQIEKLRSDVNVSAEQLTDTRIPGSSVTDGGFHNNVDVALQYLNSWLSGNGAAAIHNLMEDAATAEISRAQLWQWVRNDAKLADGRTASRDFYKKVRDEELEKLGGKEQGRLREAAEILDSLVLSGEFAEFLTLPAYRYLD
ncbi:MAG TPA: malate synthase A [Myxococcales bacterium]|jgi:malate synthase|nr:malate synthase A [Myxococcales bacterium]